MLNYTDRGLSARIQFYAPYNDISIVVEDTSLETFYTKLFNHLLGGEVNLRRVIAIGNKTQVIRRFESLKDDARGAREFYLVDGDFDELIGIDSPDHHRFYRLPRYDIESFLVEPDAIATIAEEENPDHSADHYKDEMDFREWQRSLTKSVAPMVACLVLLQQLQISPQQGRKIQRFTSGNNDLPDVGKICDFVCVNRESQSHLTEEQFDRRVESIVEQMGPSPSQLLRWISGKDILLPLVIRQLNRATGAGSVSLKSLRFRLVAHCQFDSLSELKQRVRDALPSS